MWDLAQSKRHIHRFSTLFEAKQVGTGFATDDGIRSAIEWCRHVGVTKAYIESFRTAYQVDRQILLNAKARFAEAGIEVSGCVTPTRVGKPSTRWKELISCYTDLPTQENLTGIFEHAASVFDEIMIDDFWFTDCACPQCNAAREARIVTVGDRTFPVSGDAWGDYRCELMVQLSRLRALEPAKRVNPRARLIIKYPQWYDRFHLRGYEVIRETADFDRIWAGTETRDFADKQWGGTPQYEAYFVMRWLGAIGGAKCGGGWYDPYGTTEATYVEQARQTVLGGARESLLFCYGSLLKGTGPKNIEALRANLPELLDVAEQVGRRQITGIAAYKPANSHAEKEPRIFDFAGMLGLPLVPCHEFPADAPAAFFSIHALKDPKLVSKLSAYIATGRPVLLTDSLADRLPAQVDLLQRHVHVLKVNHDPATLLSLPQETLDALREPFLQPMGASLKAPNRVAFYLFTDGSYVVESFNDEPVAVRVGDVEETIPPRGWLCRWK